MDERTMFELLEMNDAMEELETVVEMLIGKGESCGFGEGIVGKLTYVTGILKRNSQIKEDKEGTTFEKILEDKSIDNHIKARLLLGIDV